MITQKRRQIIFVMLVGVLFANIFFVSAITGSMGNARITLYPEVDGKTNTIIDRTILTKNVNNVSINITLKLDEEAKKFIELIDESYVLQPSEEKKAAFQVKVKNEGTYKGKINVFFSPMDSKEAGIVLSSTITVIAKKDQGDQENNNGEDSDTPSSITENIIGSGNSGIIFLSVSTLILLIILIFIIYYNQKQLKLKKEKSKVIKKDVKKIKKIEKKNEE